MLAYFKSILFPILFLTVGCGTTALNLRSADNVVDLSEYKSITIQTSTAQGVTVPEPAQSRMKALIKAEILNCCKERFENISLGDPGVKDLLLNVKFTIYEEGNRFARFVLAGLGSMQLHAEVEIKDAASGRLIYGGDAGKTFGWGGIYGAATGMDDLENGLAKEIITGLRTRRILPPSN
ncbi:MAG: DUF4410 domain-containing protein [Deltaproteobacteria bacterium]|nr:DUF4410 domain-containing protein [Deltaproteobacteria bacterium]